MTSEEFRAATDSILMECTKTLDAGSQEYAGDSDKLQNFKDVAELIGISPEQAAFVYFYKHVVGIAKYIKNGKEQRDTIRGREVDAIDYLLLLNGLLSERSLRANRVDPNFENFPISFE